VVKMMLFTLGLAAEFTVWLVVSALRSSEYTSSAAPPLIPPLIPLVAGAGAGVSAGAGADAGAAGWPVNNWIEGEESASPN